MQIKPGQRLLILNAPSDYAERLGPLPEGVTAATEPSGEEGRYGWSAVICPPRSRSG